ncbi:hypothetical protein [Gloeobacter kilaueensis]|uniref:hypothetical protein n=1 Tax=Gloeobacter kilaueensis TaxID=1416614 RepID=UPI0003FC4E0E|nr:hypothetical protein [Gloeobacter kilaueensis]
MKPRSFADSLREALPELIRRSGWQGLPDALPPGEQANAEEQALWQQLAAEVDAPRRSWIQRFGALRLASLATGVVAASWVLLVVIPKMPFVADKPVPPEPEATRPLKSPARHSVSSSGGTRSLPIDPDRTAGSFKPETRQAARLEQPKKSDLSSNAGNRYSSLPPRAAKSKTASAPTTGGLADQMRSLEDAPITSDASSSAQGLCQALTAQAPVPTNLEGFALVEVVLAPGEAADGSTRTLISGGEQIDQFIEQALAKLATEGRAGSGGRYRVTLETAPRRWSCKEVSDDAPGAGAGGA